MSGCSPERYVGCLSSSLNDSTTGSLFERTRGPLLNRGLTIFVVSSRTKRFLSDQPLPGKLGRGFSFDIIGFSFIIEVVWGSEDRHVVVYGHHLASLVRRLMFCSSERCCGCLSSSFNDLATTALSSDEIASVESRSSADRNVPTDEEAGAREPLLR